MHSVTAHVRIPAVFLLLCFLPALAAPPPHDFRSITSRIAGYEDINAGFQLVYSVSSACPQQVEFGQPNIDGRQVAVLPLSSTSEDGVVCTGPAPINFIGEENIRREDDLLQQLKLGGMRQALDNNPNAQQLLSNVSSTPSLLVGWHNGERNCNLKSYPRNTIYFIVNEESGKSISLKKPTQRDIVAIPPSMRAVLIVAPDNNICFLADLSSNANEDVTITVVPDDGSPPSTTPVRPGGSQPTTASSAAPAVPTPIASSGVSTVAPVASPASVPTPITSIAPSAEASPVAGAAPGGAAVGLSTPTASPVSPIPGSAGPTPVTSLAPSASVGGLGIPPGESTGVIEVLPSPEDDLILENTATADEDDGSACFPANATVSIEGSGVKMMQEVEVGDRVWTDTGYSDVIMFTHRERNTHNGFLRFTVRGGDYLTVSPGHYLYTDKRQLKSAKSFQRGEMLIRNEGGAVVIERIEKVRGRGLFNAQTVSGSIIIDGFLASTYTTSVDPIVAHGALMAPVRWLYGISPKVTASLSGMFDNGSPLLAYLLPSGESVVACVSH